MLRAHVARGTRPDNQQAGGDTLLSIPLNLTDAEDSKLKMKLTGHFKTNKQNPGFSTFYFERHVVLEFLVFVVIVLFSCFLFVCLFFFFCFFWLAVFRLFA